MYSQNQGGKKLDFSLYLVRKRYSDLEDIIKLDKIRKRIDIDLGDNRQGILFVKKSASKPPAWANLFRNNIDPSVFGKNQGTGALLLIKADDRIFLFSFGQGHHLIRVGCTDESFGLKSSLNLLREQSIRSIDKSSLESFPKQAREQTGRGVGIYHFGIDIEQDLLRALTGEPKDSRYGTSLSGREALRFSINIDIPGTASLAEDTLRAFEDQSYKNGDFAWFDHIGEIKNRAQIEYLDQQLAAKLSNQDTDGIFLCAPMVIEWERVTRFRYSNTARSVAYPDTVIDDFILEFPERVGNIDFLKKKPILALDSNDDLVFKESAYRYLYTEISDNYRTFLLNAGKWYQINEPYVKHVINHFNKIKSNEYRTTLPEYEDDNEADYNKRVAIQSHDQFALLDKNLIRLPGAAAPIEPCDLFNKRKEFIHVKRYSGSSSLSHLFNQGLVSGELLMREPTFRSEFNSKLPIHCRLSDIEAEVKKRDFKVVFAIIDHRIGELDLPFFSKISLKNAARKLEAFGFKVYITKIPYTEEKQKTKRCKSR